LDKDPKYVNYDYRKEQLWGEKLQASTENLLQNEHLKKDVILIKSKIIDSGRPKNIETIFKVIKYLY